jgi:hypothetical protein
MNRNSRSAVTKLIATVLIAIGLLMICRFWPDGPFSGLAIGCFGLTAGPVLILVAIDTGRALRKEQLGRAARIATWLPQLILGSAACIAALCGFGLAAFDRSASPTRSFYETIISVGVLLFGVSLFRKAGDGKKDTIVPHVCFKTEFAEADARRELSQMIERALRGRFDPVRVANTPFLTKWVMILHVGTKPFFLTFKLGTSKDDEVVLLVGPVSSRSVWDRIRGREAVDSTSDLMLICREIHTLFSGASGITRIRWYFAGFRSVTEGYETPDELPWSQIYRDPQALFP